MDYQKSLNDQSDYVGGIDNEGIFFDDLHVASSATANRLDNNVNHLNDGTLFLCNGKSETPLTSLTSGGRCGSSGDGGGGGGVTDTVLPSMPSITAKICLPTISQMGISVSHNHHHHHTHTHLPESPPDSGSEPPYSPPQDNHGLTFTSRDFYNPAQGNGAATSALNEMHSIPTLQQQQQQQQQQQPQSQQQQQHLSHQHIPSPTQQPPQQTSHNSYAHLLQTSLIANSLTTTTNHGHDNMNSVRVKHESGLLLNPCHLPTSTNSLRSNENGLPSTSTSPLLMYTSTNNHLGYDGLLNGNGSTSNTTPSTTSYHVSFGNGGGVGGGGSMDHSMAMAAACMLNTVSDLPHVQAIGTSHASIPSTPQLSRTSTPSTPNQSLSRKRKMIADIDDTAYVSSIKSDPSMVMSPSRNSICSTPTQQQLNGTKLSSTSPITIQLGNSIQNATSINDFGGTMSARSTASVSPALSTSNTNTDNGLDSLASNCPTNRSSENVSDSLSPCIRFSPFQPQNWHKLCDQNLQELSVVYYRVDADKGFNFSLSDDAFVCQKKNHFQITCHARLQGEAKFVKTPAGLEKIKSFHLHFFGVKLEAPNQTIRVEQSQSDRSKKPFYPVPIDLQSHIVSKVTVGRLHFSETTNNNMRKKGRPNPEQRYFQLVVALHVHTASGDFPIISQGSDKIIVRASNPGQFESDVDLCWQRGLTQDSIYHVGRVGINTDRPDESLVVHGNLKISGHIVQPSDSRAKQEIAELDTSVQLRNLQKIRIVKYRLEPEFAAHSGLKRNTDTDTDDIVDTGVIAQEVREVIPDAVQEGGSVVLPNGDVIENFLLVNKDRILMENIGAVKELCKVTGTLENRIENLERINQRLQRAKETEKLYKSISHKNENEICSNRTLQIIIFLLVIVMAICLAAVSALYFVEHNRKQHIFKHLESIQVLSNSHLLYRPDAVSLADQERMFLQNRLNKTVNFHYQTTNGSTFTAGKNFTLHRGQHSYVEPLTEAAARNDELTAIMEKPLIEQELKQSISRTTLRTTTLPLLRLNKTINSKGKIKPQMGRNTVYRTIYNRPSEGTIAPPQLINAADTASEKINSNSRLTAQQDWDSNSIDADVQHAAGVRPKGTPVIKTRLPQSKDALRHAHGGTDGQKLNSEAAIISTLNSNIYKMPDENAAVQTNSFPRANAVAAPPVPHKTNSPLIQAAVSSTTTATSSTSTTTSSPSITAATKIVQKIHTEAPPPPHSNYSLEIQPITNKSRTVLERPTDNSEDLQNLSNNNESAYNIIRDPLDLIFYNNVRSSASITDVQRVKPQQHQHRQPELTKDVNDWVIEEHLYVETFGEPEQCANKIHPADVSSCQSMCFDENNQLLTPNQLGLGLKQTEKKKSDNSAAVVEIVQKENHKRNDDDDRSTILSEDEDELQATYDGTPSSVKSTANTTSLLLVGSKVSHNGQALSKHEAESEVADIIDSLLARTFPDDNADILESKVVKKTKTEFSKQQPIPTHSLLRELNRPTNDDVDCWKVQGFLVAEHFNETFSMNEYCPKTAKSVNATIVIPLSRYFNRPNIELHLISTLPTIQWTICDNYELAKSNGKQLQQQQQQQIQILERLHNTSVLLINLPSRGDFVKYLTLRATITSDRKKESLCQEKAYETNPILQYNFRILRNCD